MTLLCLDDDIAFDTVYPAAIRRISRRFWTPVAVARRAAELFAGAGARRVLDVGAGVGKFVLVAAAVAPQIQFVGIEHRRHLVDVANRARDELGRDNARFKAADVTRMVWSAFDGFYLFNPFAENLFEGGDRIDSRVELSRKRLGRDAMRVERALRRAPLGTAIVTYHGATARIPGCYEVEACERAGTDWLRLWIRRHEVDDGRLFVEEAAGVVRTVVDAARLEPGKDA
jgi:SAM-dependent methyltransferase